MDLDAKPKAPRLLGFLSPTADEIHRQLIPVDGLTVLFGRNGAGKSRTLEAIKAWWQGYGTAIALVQLGPENEPTGPPWGYSTPEWVFDWQQAGYEPSRPEYMAGPQQEAALRAWIEECIDYDGDDALESGKVAGGRAPALVEEWFSQRLVLVSASGRRARGWKSWPATVVTPSTPYTRWAIEVDERCQSAYSADDGFEDWHVISFQPAGRLHTGEVIAQAAPRGLPLEENLRHGWYPRAASHSALVDFGISIDEEIEDLDAATTKLLIDKVQKPVEIVDDVATVSQDLLMLVRRLEIEANEHFSSALLDAPRLELHAQVIGLDSGASWGASLPEKAVNSRGNLRIGELSTAEERWARWSVRQALHSIGDGGLMSVVDEPERAVHRAAEARLAGYMNQQVSANRKIIVASHSPEFLDLPHADVLEIRRRGNGSELYALADPQREDMSRLGLLPSDLLRSQKGFLLVEGQHDLDVVTILFGERLRNLRVEVLALRGALQLSAPNVRFIFEYTPAHLFLLLDNLNASRIADAVAHIRKRLWMEGTDAARQQLVAEFPKNRLPNRTEVRVLSEFISASLDNGWFDRITPFGLTLGDIIEYLPVREFVKGEESWEQLRARHRVAQDCGDKRNFKMWLNGIGGSTSNEDVRRAVRSLSEPPQDIRLVMKGIEAVVLDSRQGG